MKVFNRTLVSTLFAALLLVLSAGCSQNPINTACSDQGCLITEGPEKVLFYQRSPKSLDGKFTRADYVHPLYDLDGRILTEDFPPDHPHHRGIFWAWHQISIGNKKLGDAWSAENLSYDVAAVKTLNLDSHSSAISAEVYWKSPLWTDSHGTQKPFLREITTIRVFPAEADIRKIDFEISLLALENGVRIGGAENEKAYGGFSARIRLPDGLEFTSPNGTVEPKSTPVEPLPWLDFSGKFGPDDKLSGLAILCHKSNPGYPQHWVLRRKKSMQNPVYPGRYPIGLSADKPLILRYRLIIHRGNASHIDLNSLLADYNAMYN